MAFRPRRPVREAIMATETTRRAFLRSVAAASAGSLAAARFAQAAGPSIVAGSFAGVWVDGLKAGVIPCYQRKTGGDVELVVGTPTDFGPTGVAKGEFGRAVLYPHLTATDGLAITWLINRELGGSLNDPSPVIKRLREMKPYITKFWTSNAEPGTALTSGEVDIAAWTDGRTFGVQAAGNKHIQFALPAPGSPMLTICFMKVKNGSDGGWEYLNCASDAKNQALWNQFFPGYY